MKKWIVAATIAAGLNASASVWKATNTWDDTWQTKYSEWISENYNETIFTSGTWSGISTDCADAAYTARMIFSFLNALPFELADGTTNNTSRFDDIKNPTQRMRAFIEYVNENTSTATLPNDTYPVAINRDTIKPGVIWLRASIPSQNAIIRFFDPNKDSGGHTETITDVDDTGVIHLIGSTVPAAVRTLIRTTSLEFPPFNQKLGFRAWILPQNRHLPVENQPGYSLEQYSMGADCGNRNDGDRDGSSNCDSKPTANGFEQAVQARLAIHAENKEEAITRHVTELCNLANERISVVNAAVKFKQSHPGCMDKDDYDNYSTPSRDARIIEVMKELTATEGGGGLFTTNASILNKITELNQCPALQIGEGKTLTLLQFLQSANHSMTSSDPNQDFDTRWGLASANDSCPKY